MKTTFQIIPASSGPIWVFSILAVFLLTLVFLFGYFVYSSRHVRFETSSGGLKIAGGLYGRTIPREALRIDAAKLIDLTRDREYGLRMRTNGVGLPGYSAGWFKLNNNSKALAFITDKRRVLYLPTTEGYVLLLSVSDADGLLTALRNS
jgi:hypothetical protein